MSADFDESKKKQLLLFFVNNSEISALCCTEALSTPTCTRSSASVFPPALRFCFFWSKSSKLYFHHSLDRRKQEQKRFLQNCLCFTLLFYRHISNTRKSDGVFVPPAVVVLMPQKQWVFGVKDLDKDVGEHTHTHTHRGCANCKLEVDHFLLMCTRCCWGKLVSHLIHSREENSWVS